MKDYSDEELIAVQSRHGDWLAAQPGVTGTSVGLGHGGQPVLRVFTSGISAATRQAIQQRLAGVPVDWEEGGEIIAY